MSLDIKSLKKLAAACRKAGIKFFKNAEFEFTLTEDAPVIAYRRANNKAPISESSPISIQSDSLSEEELLFWSSGIAQENEEPAGDA